MVNLSFSTTDTAAHQLSKEFCAWAPPSSLLISVRSMVPLLSRAHVPELLEQPSTDLLYTVRFHGTRSGQVLGESSFANPFKFETAPISISACVHTAIIFAVDQTSLFALVL